MSTFAYALETSTDFAQIYAEDTTVGTRAYTEYPRDKQNSGQSAIPFASTTIAQPAYTPTVGVIEAFLIGLKNEMQLFVRMPQRTQDAEYDFDSDVAFSLPAARCKYQDQNC